MLSFIHRQAPTGFDDKVDVRNFQSVASKQTFNVNHDQARNAAKVGIHWHLMSGRFGPAAVLDGRPLWGIVLKNLTVRNSSVSPKAQ